MASAEPTAVTRWALLARRGSGALVDAALVGAAAGYVADVGPVLGLFGPDDDIEVLLLNAAFALYFVPLWWSGGTIGHRLLGTRLVGPDGRHPSLSRALLRYIGAYLSLLPLGIGLAWAAIDRRGQGWHDRIAGTFVVRTTSGAAAASPAPVAVPAPRTADRAATAVAGGFVLAFWAWLPLLVVGDGIAGSPLAMDDGRIGWSVLPPMLVWLIFALTNRRRAARSTWARMLLCLGLLWLTCSVASAGLALTGRARHGSLPAQMGEIPVLIPIIFGATAILGAVCIGGGWIVSRQADRPASGG